MSGQLAIITPGLPAAIERSIRFTTRMVCGPDGQLEGVMVQSATLIGEHDECAIREALAVVTAACQPGGFAHATVALTKLRAMTASRPENEAEQHLTGKAYAEEMARYPADIIDEACQRCADVSRWWPAWADLKRECDRLASVRRAEHQALKAALSAPAEQPPQPEEEPTREQRLRDVIRIWTDRGQLGRAAGAELVLAKLEGREPGSWALNQARAASAAPMNLELAVRAQERRQRILESQ
jgi:hypothetical protein